MNSVGDKTRDQTCGQMRDEMPVSQSVSKADTVASTGQVWLASGSPQRLALLRQVGIEPRVLPVDIDESVLAGESAQDYVARLSLAKAREGQRLINKRLLADKDETTELSGHAPGQLSGHRQKYDSAMPLVIGADTTIALDRHILTKPENETAAINMLLQLSGRQHTVLTGTAIVTGPGTVSAVVKTSVTFGVITPEDAAWYVATGEPMNKAGSYAIQGLGARFVESLEGSYSNVVGLPLYELIQLLREAGLDPNMTHV